MIIVGYLYNTNGMASWCIEAAIALHLKGEKVVLIKSSNTRLPDNFPVSYIEFDEHTVTEGRTLMKKGADKVYLYYKLLPFINKERNFLLNLHNYLKNCSITPKAYLLNQSDLLNNKVPIPQYVVAWSYKPFLKDYIMKSFFLAEGLKSLQYNLYNAFYWYKADWAGYKSATGILSVSDKLSAILNKRNIAAHTVYPGVNSEFTGEIKVSGDNNTVKLAVMALHLDDKRKGLKRIIVILKKLKPYNFKLTLIGECSDAFKTWVSEDSFPAIFTGQLNRENAISALIDCDVFLFGSLVDDWGFVQVEAMSKGLAVLAPDSSPFDEIIGREDYLYELSSEKSLETKLKNIINSSNTIQKDKTWFKNRYTNLFSSQIFGTNLLQTIKKN